MPPIQSLICSRPPLGLTALALLAGGLSSCGNSYPPVSGMSADSAFAAVILPVLRDQCQGCHFPGGPMYRDLPFDDPRLVAERGEELLLQLEGQGRSRLQEWLALARQDPPSREQGRP